MTSGQFYAVHQLVPPHLAADRPALEAFMRAMVTDGAEREGYTVDPETFELNLIERNRINGEPILTEEERAAGLTGNEPLAAASMQCVQP